MAMPPALKEALDKKKGDSEEKKKDEEKKEEMDKSAVSDLSEEDLSKAMDAMESFLSKSVGGRKQELLRKSLDGSASEEEQAELASILAGGGGAVEEVAKALAPEENEEIEKSLGETGYLDSLHDGILKSTMALADRIEKSQSQQDEFNVVLATGILNMGRAIADLAKSMPETAGLPTKVEELTKSVEQIANAPVAQPRGLTGAKPLQQGGEQMLNKSQVSGLLTEMLQKSVNEGRDGAARCGEDLSVASTNWELHGSMSDALRQELMAFRAQRMG